MRRIAMIFCLAALAPAFLRAQTCHGPGTERWPIKTSLPTGANPAAAGKPISLRSLLSLGDPAGLRHNDARYQAGRIPAFSNALGVKEGDLVATRGWLYLVATEPDDCDYHIQISPKARTTTNKPTTQDNCMVVEAPRPDFISSPGLSGRSEQVRSYIKTKLLKNKEPSNGGSVMQHPLCVRVTGQLFYDDAHIGSNGKTELRGKRGMDSHTLWELHPITNLMIMPPSNCPS